MRNTNIWTNIIRINWFTTDFEVFTKCSDFWPWNLIFWAEFSDFENFQMGALVKSAVKIQLVIEQKTNRYVAVSQGAPSARLLPQLPVASRRPVPSVHTAHRLPTVRLRALRVVQVDVQVAELQNAEGTTSRRRIRTRRRRRRGFWGQGNGP